jgi:hypothetical protein
LVRETSAAVERRVARRDEPAVGDRRPAIGEAAVSEAGVSEAARAVNVRSAQEGAAGRTKATHPIAMGLRKDGPPGIPRGGAGDEIQIHIGRIEVTAMPPAAPRPVAAPVRKTQTLDEYLRRGNGRAG